MSTRVAPDSAPLSCRPADPEDVVHQALNAVVELLEFPGIGYGEAVREARVKIALVDGPTAERFDSLMRWATSSSDAVIEDLFSRTFDLSPLCFPYCGYHLHGEDYARGQLMAGLKIEMESVGINVGTELPDYAPLLIRLFVRLDDAEKRRSLAADLLLPAFKVMHAKLAKAANVYAAVFDVLIRLIASAVGVRVEDIRTPRLPLASLNQTFTEGCGPTSCN